MTKENQNFVIYAGDSKDIFVEVTDENGDPLNLTNIEIDWIAYNDIDQPAIIFKTGDQIQKGIGYFNFRLNHIDTEELEETLHHEAIMTDAAGFISTLMKGKMFIRERYRVADLNVS